MHPLVLVLAVSAAVAPSGPPDTSIVPDPDLCTVVPCDDMEGILTAPFAGSPGPQVTEFTVTVLTWPGIPVPNAFVEVIMHYPTNHVVCSGAMLYGITDSQGQVTMNLAMGGCSLVHDAVRIRVNGVDIRVYDRLLSPDFDGEADGTVGLTDFCYFGSKFVAGAPGCTDYFNDQVTGLEDFAAFGECWAGSCGP